MKKALSNIIIITIILTLLSFTLSASSYASDRLPGEKISEFESYIKFLKDNYVLEVDYETLIDGAFSGALSALSDPYSIYYSPLSGKQAPDEAVTGEYVGIGVQLEMFDGGRLSGKTYVVSVLPGSPAEKAGILGGDIISEVDGKDVTSMLSLEITSLLRGEPGTEVSVTVDRGRNGIHTYTMKRERVEITISFYEMMEADIGYIKLTVFGGESAPGFVRAKDELMKAGAKSLIIDLRDNAGGNLFAALEIANELIEKGDLLHLVQKGKTAHTFSAIEKKLEKIPVILLINEKSMSAAEVLAAALQDNKAAVIVGTKSYGKGYAQLLMQTGSGQNFRVSAYELLRPSKGKIEGAGVTPDYKIKNSAGERREDAAKAYEAFAAFAEETKPAPGDIGLDVFAAQQRLALMGYSLLPTAIMDEVTVNAIKAFQKEQGLWAYGVLDYTTKRKIDEAALAYINNESKEDLQLMKAMELLLKSNACF